MTTPHTWSHSTGASDAGPSRTLLQKLLEEINLASNAKAIHNECASRSPTSTRTSSHNHSPSVWVGGTHVAQDARRKLRTADEAHQRKLSTNAVDGTPDLQTPMLYLDTDLRKSEAALHGTEDALTSELQQTPDPVQYPNDYVEYMLEGSPLSTAVGISPVTQGHDFSHFHLQASALSNDIPRPLSPLMFSDVDFDDSSCSPQTELTISPTEAPTSAATVDTIGRSHVFKDDESIASSKRFYLPDDTTPEASPRKRRNMTLPDLRDEAFSRLTDDAPSLFIGVGGDDRCVYRNENFTERAPIPRMSVDMSTTHALPELSSFRPSVTSPPDVSPFGSPVRTLARAFTSPVQPVSLTVPDTPAWMRPMHLIDLGDKSIYMNTHDDGPIRHALCLYCFRTRGSFQKVHRYGYETCGRTEVLDSHYWESECGLDESSDSSTASDC